MPDPDPTPLEFTDYRAYLRAWFEHRDGRPSMRGFARSVHCSTTLVSQVCSGQRNLGETRAEFWLKRLGLGGEEASHFLTLVRFAEAPTDRQREEAWQAIRATQHFRHSKPDVDTMLELLGDWLRPVIHELARTEGFRADPAWIRERLGPPVSEEQIATALAWLQEAGLVGPDLHGRMQALNDAIASDQNVTLPAMSHQLHRMQPDLLAVATERLSKVPPRQRNYAAAVAALSEEQYTAIQEEIQAFQRRVFLLAGGDDGNPRDRVYQLTMQWYPMTAVDRD